MSRKLILSILVLSFALLELLAVRQAQINTVNEMTRLHIAIDKNNELINALSIEIERSCSPIQFSTKLAAIEPLNASK
jgi:hypothetical protein|tara:strand:- start:76 stop:309 length:234 start_codon:yes stop_codon:yes gene_type:complete